MRKFFVLILVLLLLPLPLAGAETAAEPAAEAAAETVTPAPTMTPEEWHYKYRNKYERKPEHIEIVPWDELPPVQEGQHHYLLLCIDQWVRDARPDDADPPTQSKHPDRRRDMYGNTDGIVLLTLDTRAHRIMLTSIIRDAIVRKHNSTEDLEKFTRINYVYNDYGPEVLCQTISEHLGVRIEKYILFTFKQIANIVDYMGGVEIELNSAEIDALKYTTLKGTVTGPDGKDLQDKGVRPEGVYTFKTTEWAEEQNRKAEAKNTQKNKVVKRTGGVSAVLYMRIRKFGGGGDFMRTQRARNVLSLLADKCRTMTWEDAQALANNIAENNNKTNMTLADMIEAAKYAFGLRDCTIEEFRVPHNDFAVRRINFAAMATEEINWPYVREAFEYYLQNTVLTADEPAAAATSTPVPEISSPDAGEAPAPAAGDDAASAPGEDLSGYLVSDDD